MKQVQAGVLQITYLESGSAGGSPVLLLHGFPYDVHSYDAAAERLAAAGYRVIMPYLRGFGPSRFLHPDTPRSGQQAALGSDLLALLDALQIRRAILAGYDWGGRASCVVAALWPERVSGLVSCGTGYNLQNAAQALKPIEPEKERLHWYWYYLNSERGKEGAAWEPPLRRAALPPVHPSPLCGRHGSGQVPCLQVEAAKKRSRGRRRLTPASPTFEACVHTGPCRHTFR